MPKPFITYDQQIALLKSKHLIISDEDAAKRASLSQNDLLSAMGFPSNWKNISRRYKL